MRITLTEGNRPRLLLIGGLTILACVAGLLVSRVQPMGLITATLAIAVFVVAFVNPEVGLYLLIFAMLLSPEIAVGEIAGGATLGRGITLRLDDFVLVVIGLAWFARAAIKKDLGLFLRTPLNRPIFYYVLACCISTGLGVVAGRVQARTGFFFVLKYLEYFIVYFMVANHVRDTAQVRRFLFCIFLTCLVISAYGLLQVPGGGRVSAPFEGVRGEPNTLGGYLMFMGLLAVGLLYKTRSSWETSFYLLVLVAGIVPFVFTESRSSYAAALMAAIAFSTVVRRKGLVIMAIVAIALSGPLWLPSRVKERINYTFNQPMHVYQVEVAGVRLDTSTSARLMRMREAYQDWTKRPLFGYGITGYGFLDSQYAKVLVETGLVGLAAFLYLIYCVFKMARSNLRSLKDDYHLGIAMGYTAGLAGLLVHALGANTFIIVRIMEPFWFLTGIMVMLPALDKKEQAGAASGPGGRGESRALPGVR